MPWPFDNFDVQHPISDSGQRQLVALRLARSRKSLRWLLGEDKAALDLFSEAKPEQVIAVYPKGADTPVGMASWCLGGRDAFVVSGGAFRRHYGLIGGTVRLAIYRAINWFVTSGDGVYVNTLWVDPAWRAKGAGLMVLLAISSTVREPLMADLRADNRRYRRLLEWWGMQPVTRGWRKPVWHLLGLVRMKLPERIDGADASRSYYHGKA